MLDALPKRGRCSVAAPSFKGNLDHREHDTDRRKKALGPLPVLLVAFHPPLKIGDAAAVAVTHQVGDLRLKHAQVALHLCFEFIHHSHSLNSIPLRNENSRLTIQAAD